MSVKKESSARRSVQVEVEVPGTPEEVWQAIASGPGISSWFVPAEFEERDGKPVAAKLNFGPGMASRSAVTAWDPPRMFVAQGEGWGGSPPITTEWGVEARAGGVCLVRVVHSLVASTDDWDNQLVSTESGWPGFFRILRSYLTHFRGQRYDSLNRLTYTGFPDGGALRYNYASPTEVDVCQDQTTANDKALHNQTLYDGLGRQAESDTVESGTSTLACSGKSQYIATTQSFDGAGRVIRTTNPSRQNPADGLGYATSYAYDTLGRQTSATTPDGLTTTTTYSGNTTTVKDPVGNQRELVTDALGRVTDVYESPNSQKFHTIYTLDPSNNLRKVVQGSQTRTFVYDLLSRLTSANNPESGTVNYTYDNVGNVLSRTDARGTVTCFGTLSGSTCSGTSYDALNRPGSIRYSDYTLAVTYSYDSGTNGIGHLTQVANPNSTTSYTAFDPMGRVTASTQQTSESYTFTYTYNLAGALTSETYPSGRVLTTSYDSANRPITLTGNLNNRSTNYVTSTSYWANGGITSLTRGNNLVHAETYNNRLQLTGVTETAAGGALLNLGLNWVNPSTSANNGTLQSLTTTGGGLAPTQSFAYDSLNRLLTAAEKSGANQNWQQPYSYDQYGNMWMPPVSGGLPAPPTGPAAPTANVYNPANNKNTNSTYDAAGNLTAFGSLSVTYDAENRQQSAGTASYSYDGAGQRVSKYVSGLNTTYVYDAFGQLSAEYNPTPASTTAPCATCYLAGDHLGSLRLVTDAGANVIARHDFAPFGQEIPSGVGGRTTVWGATDAVSQRFTGQVRDAETNLDFFNARYLSSGLGRFMSVDPGNAGADGADPQTWNGYGYVRNTPLSLVDPSGMTSCSFANPCTGLYPSGSSKRPSNQFGNLNPFGPGNLSYIATTADLGESRSTSYEFYTFYDSVSFLEPINASLNHSLQLPAKNVKVCLDPACTMTTQLPGLSDKEKNCMGQAFKKNAVSLGLDVASLGLSLVPGGGFVRTAATFASGAVLASTSGVLSAANGQTSEALVTFGNGVATMPQSVMLAEVVGAKTVARALPIVGTIVSGLELGYDGWLAYQDYQACMAHP